MILGGLLAATGVAIGAFFIGFCNAISVCRLANTRENACWFRSSPANPPTPRTCAHVENSRLPPVLTAFVGITVCGCSCVTTPAAGRNPPLRGFSGRQRRVIVTIYWLDWLFL